MLPYSIPLSNQTLPYKFLNQATCVVQESRSQTQPRSVIGLVSACSNAPPLSAPPQPIAQAIPKSAKPKPIAPAPKAVRSAPLAKKALFVSLKGNDGNPGTLKQPFRTIQKAANIATAGYTVYLRSGEYEETQIQPKHSGTAQAPITFQAYPGETVTVSSTRTIVPGQNQIGRWEPYDRSNGKAIYKIQLSPDWHQGDGKNQVFVNHTMATEAQWPNVKDIGQANRSDFAISTAGSLDADLGSNLYQATYRHPGIQSFWKGGRINFVSGQDWYGISGKIVNASEGQLQFQAKDLAKKPVTPNQDDAFVLAGRLEALDTPGEWFYDAQGEYGAAHTLYLWAPTGDPAQQWVHLRTKVAAWNLADRRYITVKNLAVRAGKIYLDGKSEGIVLDRIVSRFGEHDMANAWAAIVLDGRNNRLINSEVSHSQGFGVLIRGTNQRVENNYIHHTGYDFMVGGGIRTENTTGSKLLRNTIHTTGGHGISFETLFAGEIKYNRVSNAGTHATDIGGINSFGGGDQKGTEVAYNYVYDINAYANFEHNDHSGGFGIRLDSGGSELGSSNVVIHHNRIGKTSARSIEIFGLTPGMPNYGDAKVGVYHNTTLGTIATIAGGTQNPQGIKIINNISLGKIETLAGNSNGVVIRNNLDRQTDAQLFNPQSSDFRLKATSPAINQAARIPKINDRVADRQPDLGALEYGQSFPAVGRQNKPLP